MRRKGHSAKYTDRCADLELINGHLPLTPGKICNDGRVSWYFGMKKGEKLMLAPE